MRALKTLVIVMGVMIAVGVTVLAITIINRISAPPKLPSPPGAVSAPLAGSAHPAQSGSNDTAPARPMASTPASPAPIGISLPPSFDVTLGDVSVPIPAGGRVSDFSTSTDRLVLRVIMPDQQQRLLVVDLTNGKLLGTISLVETNADGSQPASGATGSGPLAPLPAVTVPPRNKQEGAK